MFIFGCLLAMTAAFAPRAVIVIMWIFGNRISLAFDSWIWPMLGLIFAPYTLIMWILVWDPIVGIAGWDWLWILLGVWLDFLKWARVYENRNEVPGYPATAES